MTSSTCNQNFQKDWPTIGPLTENKRLFVALRFNPLYRVRKRKSVPVPEDDELDCQSLSQKMLSIRPFGFD